MTRPSLLLGAGCHNAFLNDVVGDIGCSGGLIVTPYPGTVYSSTDSSRPADPIFRARVWPIRSNYLVLRTWVELVSGSGSDALSLDLDLVDEGGSVLTTISYSTGTFAKTKRTLAMDVHDVGAGHYDAAGLNVVVAAYLWRTGSGTAQLTDPAILGSNDLPSLSSSKFLF